MTIKFQESLLHGPRRTGTPEEQARDGGVWLPVITVPATFVLCLVMFFVLHTG